MVRSISYGEVHFMVFCWSFWCQPILKIPSTTPSCCHSPLSHFSALSLSVEVALPACDPSGMIKHWQKNGIGKIVMGRIRPVFQICFFPLALYKAHRTWTGRWFPLFQHEKTFTIHQKIVTKRNELGEHFPCDVQPRRDAMKYHNIIRKFLIKAI